MKFNNRNVYISPKAKIGKNVRIGDNTSIYDHVEIGDDSIICNDCVIGEPLAGYYDDKTYVNPKTVIGARSLIRSHCILYADSQFGENFSTGHRVTIREKTVMGDKCRVGTLSDIQGHSTFGNHVWLHSNVHIGQKSKVGNFVFFYPYSVLTNDPHPPSNICIGPTIDDFAQFGVGAVILPGLHIGKHALIAAQALVTKDVAEYQLVGGNPAKLIKDVREVKEKDTGVPHYPWPYRFDRGMPWAGIGFDSWLEQGRPS